MPLVIADHRCSARSALRGLQYDVGVTPERGIIPIVTCRRSDLSRAGSCVGP